MKKNIKILLTFTMLMIQHQNSMPMHSKIMPLLIKARPAHQIIHRSIVTELDIVSYVVFSLGVVNGFAASSALSKQSHAAGLGFLMALVPLIGASPESLEPFVASVALSGLSGCIKISEGEVKRAAVVRKEQINREIAKINEILKDLTQSKK